LLIRELKVGEVRQKELELKEKELEKEMVLKERELEKELAMKKSERLMYVGLTACAVFGVVGALFGVAAIRRSKRFFLFAFSIAHRCSVCSNKSHQS
jgi:hypothetical protein